MGRCAVPSSRLNFFESKKRRELWKRHGLPIRAYVHADRMGFLGHTGNRATDSIAYMHAVWQKGLRGQVTQLRVI